MLPVYFDVKYEVKKIINANVGYMFDMLKCTCEDLSYAEILDAIYPSGILESKYEKCVKTIKELYNMTQDDYDREYLDPFYEWILYYTILWWIDVADDIVLDEVPKKYCIDEYGVDRYEYINNVDNYLDFLFEDWDFLDLHVIYSLYKEKPYMLKKFLHIDIERYLELMPPDIERECRELKERKQDIMDRKNNVTLNISGGQFNISKDSSTLNAVQNNGTSGTELEKIIKGIMDNVNELNKNDADQITDIAEMVKQELSKPEPRVSRLSNCLKLIAPMLTIANGIPTLYDNLQKLQEFIMQYIPG